MADQLNMHDEDDQLAAAKRFWHNYAKPVLGGIVIAGAGLLAWNWWQDHREAQAEAASIQYQQLTQIVSIENPGADERETAQQLIDTLRDQYASTLYADLAGLIQARLAVDAGELDAAYAALAAVRDDSSREEIDALAGLDQARIALGRGDGEEALSIIASLSLPDTLAARGADIRGDALYALGRQEEARSAWQDAIALAREHQQALSGTQLKLDDLPPAEAS